MATDGVKIIDSDTAHDTYWGIMDLYDSGADFSDINKEFPLIKDDHFDDFDNEIYVTSCALAMWEIGQMTENKLAYVKSIIDKGACVKSWDEEGGPKEGKARQKVLNNFWKKISVPNTKVRGRKKYRKVTNFLFQQDDLLVFKLKCGNYCAVICAAINQYRGECTYTLVPTTYKSNKKPVVKDLTNKQILGREISSGFDRQKTKEMQPGVERVWQLKGDKCCFFFGVVQYAINHRDLIKFKGNFEKVGTLKIVSKLKAMGSLSYYNTFESFEESFIEIENSIKAFGYKKYPIKALCEI